MRCKALLALAALSVGCNRAVPTREAAIEAARTLELAADLSVELDGALITSCPDTLMTPEADEAPVVCVRLTAFDAEIRVVDSGCAPRAVRVHVQNAASDAVVGWRAFRAGESTARAATRGRALDDEPQRAEVVVRVHVADPHADEARERVVRAREASVVRGRGGVALQLGNKQLAMRAAGRGRGGEVRVRNCLYL
jgi:hypothetical protein